MKNYINEKIIEKMDRYLGERVKGSFDYGRPHFGLLLAWENCNEKLLSIDTSCYGASSIAFLPKLMGPYDVTYDRYLTYYNKEKTDETEIEFNKMLLIATSTLLTAYKQVTIDGIYDE